MADQGATIEHEGVRLTHADRVVYPEQGTTKRELADYYRAVADWMLPHVSGRPLSVVRCPKGRGGKCFFQKHTGQGMPEAIGSVKVKEKEGQQQYLCIDDADGLVGLVQMGVLEIHPWGSRAGRLEKPGQVIFDLDPGPGVEWKAIVAAARAMRELLDGLELESYAKITGGKGIHVVVPLKPKAGWDDVLEFAHGAARHLAQTDREKYVVNMSKSKRRGKIFVDYLRNGRGATAVAAYSTRARDGAPIAVPVRWEELGRLNSAAHYTLDNILRRLSSLRDDPWDGYFETNQSLTAARVRSATE